MNRFFVSISFVLGVILLMACKEEEDYYYPSVKLEFVTVEAGADGRLQTLIPDKGAMIQISEDGTGSTLVPHSLRRVISNYEVLLSEQGEVTAKVYSLQSVVTPEPKKKDDPAFSGGLKVDPVEVTSLWIGREHLNMILTIKVKGGKQHVFGIVEENTEETASEKVVTLSLFHNASKDEELYSRRVYLSVPLKKYAEEGSSKSVRIKFKYHTYDQQGGIIESEKYCQPGLVYVPARH